MLCIATQGVRRKHVCAAASCRTEALPIVDAMLKRFPLALARACLPHFLCAAADVAPPAELVSNPFSVCLHACVCACMCVCNGARILWMMARAWA